MNFHPKKKSLPTNAQIVGKSHSSIFFEKIEFEHSEKDKFHEEKNFKNLIRLSPDPLPDKRMPAHNDLREYITHNKRKNQVDYKKTKKRC